MRPALRPVLALLASLAAAPAPASADSSADEAEARFQRGAALYRQGRYEEALLEFFTSNRLAPNRNVRFNIARTYEALKKYDEAYRYYAEYLREETDQAERAAIEKRLADLAPRVALLRVVTEPPGATVWIDRKDLGGRGETPLVVALPPGAHAVIVERAGYEARTAEATLVRGQVVDVALPLEAIVGAVRVTSTPAAELRVDRDDQDSGAPDAITPATLELPPGRHSLELRAAGHRPRRRDVIVVAHQAVDVNVALEAIPPPAGTVVLQTRVPGALVTVDGAAQGFTPAVLSLVAGRHRVVVAREGFEPWEQELEVAEGARAFVDVPLRRREAEVTGAKRSVQLASQAPASVTLITRAEIEAFGYETLADALRAVRGLYDSDDRNYRALGIRGFSRPGDYSNRVLVLRDGHVVNDDWVGAGFIGRDFAPDLEDVERIEVVRGPGSTFYGPGAFFGVVNVVSLGAGAGASTTAGAAATSEGGVRGFARGATRAGPVDVAVAASAYDSEGQTLHFAEFEDEPSAGFVAGADGEEAEHAALRARWGDFALDAAWNRRDKEIPTASYDTVFDPGSFAPTGRRITGTIDERAFVEGRWERAFGATRLRARLAFDHADYAGRWPYDAEAPEQPFLLSDAATSLWYGGEAQASLPIPGRQRLTVGGDVAWHEVTQSVNEDSMGEDEFHDPHTFVAASVYAVDEIVLSRRLRFTGGARLDRSGGEELTSLSPRLAAVATPYDGGNTKVIVGRAFRAPSVYELYYEDGGVTQIPAGALDAETIWTADLEHTHTLGDRSYVTAALFANRIDSLIVLVEDDLGILQFQNSADEVVSGGAELEARWTWESGAWVMGAVSATAVKTDDPTARWNSSPVIGLARAFWPAAGEGLGLAAELVYNAPRPTRDDTGADERTAHAVLANLVLSGRVAGDKLRFRLGVYNLLDWDWDVAVGDELRPLTIRQNGRTFAAQLAYEY